MVSGIVEYGFPSVGEGGHVQDWDRGTRAPGISSSSYGLISYDRCVGRSILAECL